MHQDHCIHGKDTIYMYTYICVCMHACMCMCGLLQKHTTLLLTQWSVYFFGISLRSRVTHTCISERDRHCFRQSLGLNNGASMLIGSTKKKSLKITLMHICVTEPSDGLTVTGAVLKGIIYHGWPGAYLTTFFNGLIRANIGQHRTFLRSGCSI